MRLITDRVLTLGYIDSSETLLRRTTTLNDPLGRVISRTQKMLETGEDVSYTYGYANLPAGGQEITITDPLGRISRVTRNGDGMVTREEDAAGNVVEYFYEDGRGNMTRKVEKEKTSEGEFNTHVSLYEYNAFNKVEKITENADTEVEAVTTFTYNQRGQVESSEDAKGRTITHEYDSLGRRIKTTRNLESGVKAATLFAYDDAGNMASVTDANGNITRYEYDTTGQRNWLTKVIYPDNTTREFTYDLAGNVLTTKQRNGTKVTNTYDGRNLLTNRAIVPAAGVEGAFEETYVFDGLSRLVHVHDEDASVDFAYDSLNRRISENQNGKLIRYTYNEVNNLLSIRYPNQRIIEREFDELNRVMRVKEGGGMIADMEFIGRSLRMLSKGYGNGDEVKFLYDAGRRNTAIDAKNRNQQIINRYAYGFNKVNLKTYEQRMHDNGLGNVFAYDALNRIKGVRFDSPEPTDPMTAQFEKAKTYTLDKLDNILKIVENENETEREILTGMEGVNLKLNQYSRFDKWNLEYDGNANTKRKGVQAFSYDYQNRLVKATDPDGTTTMQYDPLGRRISKSGPGGTIHYYYAGNRVIEERNGSDQVTRQYIYGNGIDELFRLDVHNGGTSTPYYIHANHIGSTTAITDAEGNLIERVDYDTFGMPSFTDSAGQPIATSSIGNTTLFQGREYDPELNLYHYRARAYDPIMGRFLQTDPMGYQDSMNLYQAFNMNPWNYLDPWGLAVINLFINEREAKLDPMYIPTTDFYGNIIRRTYCPFPNWNELKQIAEENGHKVNLFFAGDLDNQSGGRTVKNFNSDDFQRSVRGWRINNTGNETEEDDEVWTIFVGHSYQEFENSNLFEGIKLGEQYINFPMEDFNNGVIGIFACSSSTYARRILPGAKHIAAYQDNSGEGLSKIQRNLWAAHQFVLYLIQHGTGNMQGAIEAANSDEGLNKIPYDRDENDKIIQQ